MKIINAYRNESTIVAFFRDDAGVLTTKKFPAPFTMFLKQEDVDSDMMRVLKTSSGVSSITKEDQWLRINARSWDHLHNASTKGLAAYGLKTYEADVSPIRRWLIEGGYEIARPKRVYLDFEADSRVPFDKKEEARILCWSLVDEEGKITTRVLSEDTDVDEAEILKELWVCLEEYDQVLAWNGDRYDFPLLEARTKLHNLRCDYRRLLWLDQLVLFRRMNTGSAESGDEKQSLALNAVATALLGEGKHDVDASKAWQMWEAGGEDREKLVKYCEQDTKLLPRIEAKTGYTELLQTLCDVCRVFPDSRGLNPTQQVEAFLLSLAWKRGRKFATWHRREEIREDADPYKGAYVMDPTCKGIVRDVHVADFARLYPSIIMSWNMSPETWIPAVKQKTRPKYMVNTPASEDVPQGSCIAPGTKANFMNEPQGVLPAAVAEMLRLRKEWDKKKAAAAPGSQEWTEANRRSTAYKIAANSFYGVIGSPFSRFFVREVAESVALSGVWLIKETIKAASAHGMETIYGDTDSLFVIGASKTKFENFVEWCNSELYPKLLKERGCTRNEISLAYEKAFDRFVIVSKKRYAARYLHYKGTASTDKSKHEIKGLEYKRGDSVRFARQFQASIVDKLLTKECDDPVQCEQIVREWRSKILNDNLELEQVVLSKRLSKELDDYSRRSKKDGTPMAQLPHVELARKMKESGQDVGSGIRIAYVVVDGSSSPIRVVAAEQWDGVLDRFYLWEDLVWPPTQRLLEAAFPTHDWAQWTKVRPKKVRIRKKSSDSQTDLFCSASLSGHGNQDPNHGT